MQLFQFSTYLLFYCSTFPIFHFSCPGSANTRREGQEARVYKTCYPDLPRTGSSWGILQGTLYPVQWTVCSVQCAVCSVQCAVCSVSVSHTPITWPRWEHWVILNKGRSPRVQYYQCSRGLVWGLGHWHYTTAGLPPDGPASTRVSLTNVTPV